MPTISVFYGIVVAMFFNDHDHRTSMRGTPNSKRGSRSQQGIRWTASCPCAPLG